MITVSTSRYDRQAKEKRRVEDESGDLAQRVIEGAKGVVVERALVPDDAKLLRGTVSRALGGEDLDVIVLTGGTGVSTTDVTIETVRPLFEKEIEGFGEIFRSVSFQRIGVAAALSRATAGVAKGKVVLCLPGSPDAVRTALELFVGEIPHVLHLARGR
ncbi:MAG: MogA/MoaB family molybdenum cofactor biosynthesis protein [Thaumarchaeota archaeon]|nr:MogA/MoaB family molybdenum cofactor biosynthesis protein [Nitrososphaerota archaeon]